MIRKIDRADERVTSRARLLVGGAVIAMVSLAGCSTDPDDGSDAGSDAETIQSDETSTDLNDTEDAEASRSAGSNDDAEDAENSENAESSEISDESDDERVAEDAEPATDETTTSTTAGAAASASTTSGYISSYAAPEASQLFAYISGDLDLIGVTVAGDTPVQITDVAAVDNTLYGISFDQLFLIDTETAAATVVGGITNGDFNSLVALPDGRLLAGGLSGTLAIIDPETGAADQLGLYPSGLVSSGDLVVMPDGTVLGSANNGDAEFLVSVDPDTGATATAVEGLPRQLWGLLLSAEGELLGLTATPADRCAVGEIIEIDTASGSFTSVGCTGFVPGGATNSAGLQDLR